MESADRSYLRELLSPVCTFRGVGPKTEALLDRLGIRYARDLLLHLPRNYLDRTRIDPLSEAASKSRANCIVEVTGQRFLGWKGRGTRILKVVVRDRSATASLLCFGRSYLGNVFVPGSRHLVSGSFRCHRGELQSANFDHEPLSEFQRSAEPILPVYRLTEGISQRLMRSLVRQALSSCPEPTEELPLRIRRKQALPSLRDALVQIHYPADAERLEAARRYFIFHELFYLQLIMMRRGMIRRFVRPHRRPVDFRLKNALLSRLPFRLTEGQESALSDVEADLFSDRLMSRLVQGDVGSGKTLVALLAAVSVVESGGQAAVMAPTELLARQHADRAAGLLEPLGVRVGLLTGTLSAESRNLLLSALRAGTVQIVVGTHALFSADVTYARLGLVVVDEQQRFGVQQRRALLAKGSFPDLLLMTATPIPRTLALTAFGDLDVSTIDTMPPGRKPVITHLSLQGNEHRVYARIRNEVQKGRQAYFVYPLIEKTAKTDLKAAEQMFTLLREEVFPDLRLGLIHSRLAEEEKESQMADFAAGSIDILVATSVVEVGVDVPNATCMVVEHAERFGLSALHQLRGRVGRSDHQSFAFLIYSKRLTEDGIRRLKIMKETTDGFRIASEDLAIRGPGELLGLRQAGFLRLLAADLSRDVEVLMKARKDVASILSTDPGLLSPENREIARVLKRCPPFAEEKLDAG